MAFWLVPACMLAQVAAVGFQFLRISPSAVANGMGETYGLAMFRSPVAGIFQPAAPALKADRSFAAFAGLFPTVKWVKVLSYSASGLEMGTSLKPWIGMPFSLGVGIYEVRMDYGKTVFRDDYGNPIGSVHPVDRSRAVSLSVALRKPVLLAFGYTWKQVRVEDPFFTRSQEGAARSASVSDFGGVIWFPVSDWLSGSERDPDVFYPEGDFGLYFGKLHVEKQPFYSPAGQRFLFPRTFYTGFGIRFRIRKGEHSRYNPVFSLALSREIAWLLIQGDKYTSIFSGSGYWGAFMGFQQSYTLTVKRGGEIGLGNLFFVRWGKYDDRGSDLFYKTVGFGLDVGKAALLLTERMGKAVPLLDGLDRHFFLKVNFASFSADKWSPLDGTDFWAWTAGCRW